MFKRIALTFLVTALTVGLFGGYFFHIGKYASRKSSETVCNIININVLDSLESGIVNKGEVLTIVSALASGRRIDSIDLYSIEKMLDNKGEIKKSEVFISHDGILDVEITQRLPVVRFEKGDRHFYSDIYGYVFPVNYPVRVPVVTGAVKLEVGKGYRGYADSASIGWIRQIADVAQYISRDSYWSRQIAQLDIQSNGDIVLYTASGDRKFIFGDASAKEEKFKKMEVFYRDIAPQQEAGEYKTVNLKYKNQIICK